MFYISGLRKTHDEIKVLEPERYDQFWNSPHQFVEDIGESFDDLNSRLKQFLKFITSEHTEGNLLIVTHTVFIKMLLAYIKNLPISELWAPPYIKDTSLTILEYQNGHFTIRLEADTEHLLTEDIL